MIITTTVDLTSVPATGLLKGLLLCLVSFCTNESCTQHIQAFSLSTLAAVQLFEESARQVRKEALHHADHLNKQVQQQLQEGLDQKADAAALGREGQSSRKQLTELWAEAEAAREGLDQLKGSWQQVQGQVHALHDTVAITEVIVLQAGSVALP